jgi:hypothetical protein
MKAATVPVVKDQEVNRAIQALAQNFNAVAKKNIEIYTITISLFASFGTAVNHRLGRVPAGFFIVDCTGDIRVWRTKAATESTITLQSSVDGTVTLLLF